MKYLLILALLTLFVDPNAIYSEEMESLEIVSKYEFRIQQIDQMNSIIPVTNEPVTAEPYETIDPSWPGHEEFSDSEFDFPEREFPDAPDYYRFANAPEFETTPEPED